MSQTQYYQLFEPFTINSLQLKNRLAFAPLGMVNMSDTRGGFTERAQNYYVERAKGGTGLLFSGVTVANYNEVHDFMCPCAAYDPGWFAKTTHDMLDRIHSFGSKMFLQVSGGFGRVVIPQVAKQYYAPSQQTNRWNPSIEQRAMSEDEIMALVRDVVACCASAQHAGFDGVEIHAVHEGYLLDQFAIALYNNREDDFGGSLEKGLKPAIEIVKGIKKACGSDFPVSVRFSLKSMVKGLRQGAVPGEEFIEAARDTKEGLVAAHMLEDAGYDMFNVDAGTYDSWYWNHPPMYFGHKGIYCEFGRQMKEDGIKAPIVLSGRMDDPDLAVKSLETDCDIVSLGRPLLADPEWPNKVKQNKLEDIRPCLSCHAGCMLRIEEGQQISCAVNPACGREAEYRLIPAIEKKHVLVIGGGVAGMETARVASLRGHHVELWEKTDHLGGDLLLSGAPSFKQDDIDLLHWYEYQMKKLNIPIELNHLATAEEIVSSSAEVVVIACGAKPIQIDLGTDLAVYQLNDVLQKEIELPDEITIVGGGFAGCETALDLAQHGKHVTIVEMLPHILKAGDGMCFANYDMLKDMLAYNHVKIIENAQAKRTTSDGLLVEIDNKEQLIPCQAVIESLGYRSDTALYDEIQLSDKIVYNIGDSQQVGLIMNAIWHAYQIAMEI